MSVSPSLHQAEEPPMDQLQSIFHQLPAEQQNQVLQRLQQSIQPSEVVQQNPPELTQQQPLEDSEQQIMPQKVGHTPANQQLQQNQEHQQLQPQQQQLTNLVQEMQQMLLHQQQQIQELLCPRDVNRIEFFDVKITGLLPCTILVTAAGYPFFKVSNSDKFIDVICDSVKLVTGAFVQRITPGSLCLSVVAETPATGKRLVDACKSSELMDDLNQRIVEYEFETQNKVGRVTSLRIVSKRIDDVTSEQLEVLKENAALCIEDIKARSVEEYEHGTDAKTDGPASETQKFKALETFVNDQNSVFDAFLKMNLASKDETQRKKLEIMFNTVQEIWSIQQEREYCVKMLQKKYYRLLYKFAGEIRDGEFGF